MTSAGWRITISPERGRVGEWGTWTVRCTVGATGLASGGAIRVALPDRWHQWWRNSSRRVQTTEPVEPFYVTARAVRPASGAGREARVRCEVEQQAPFRGPAVEHFVKYARTDIAGRPSRYAWVVRVAADDGLSPGDIVEVVYGDRSGGGRGFTPPLWVGSPEPVRVAVDTTGSGSFTLLPEALLPLLHASPGEPVELSLVIPSSTVVGEPAEVLVGALDAHQNPVSAPRVQVTVRVVEGGATFGSSDAAGEGEQVTFELAEMERRGAVRVPFVPRAAGLIRLSGQSDDGRLFSVSNPSRCTPEPPAERLYWGDLHSHSHLSWDGTGTGDDHFRYARDVAGLQFYGNADHGESLSPDEWEWVMACNARYHEPGRFVTLVGYEDSFGRPYGHHNVFYRGAHGALLHSRQASLPEFWAQATPGEALTIPHHTAALGRPGVVGIDWSIRDDRFRRIVEIYSSHGQSEHFAPDHPLASDVVDFTFAGPYDAPSYAQDGWMTGQRLGVIASSDNHWSQPGKDGFGIAAVYAPALTREAVFDAHANRRTYGTTGARMLLDFAVDGVAMGGVSRLEPGQAAHITARVVGSGPLRQVDVLCGDVERQEWRLAHRQWFAGGDAPLQVDVDWTDDSPPANGLYYLRVRQRDLVHGRIAMGWSSPVWIERARSSGSGPRKERSSSPGLPGG